MCSAYNGDLVSLCICNVRSCKSCCCLKCPMVFDWLCYCSLLQLQMTTLLSMTVSRSAAVLFCSVCQSPSQLTVWMRLVRSASPSPSPLQPLSTVLHSALLKQKYAYQMLKVYQFIVKEACTCILDFRWEFVLPVSGVKGSYIECTGCNHVDKVKVNYV